jgi:glyoxylase-like metal-dependent hydrolase (beta-lactamase superfamily II)
MNRKPLSASMAVPLASSVLATVLAVASAPAPSFAATDRPGAAAALHVHTSSPDGFLTNSVWIDDGREVTVVDTQFTPALAQAVVADIARRTRSPIRRVIVTHPNPDKFNGLSVFHRLGAESIASRATADRMPGVHAYKRYFWTEIARAFTPDTYPALEQPRTTFSGRMTVPLANGDSLTLFELATPGVSATQTAVRLDSTGDLVVGDLVANRTHAWLEGAVDGGRPVFDLAGWKAALRELPALAAGKPGARLHAGRGPALPVTDAVPAQLAYLDAADEAIRAEEQVLGGERAALADPTRQAPHVRAIRERLVARFPSHSMPELLDHSLYGWLASRAR